ncbi:MAG: response regulator [Verrucomicrobia bacterium]|nr:response regulator [Verrucomicrobiota bacterium]
MKRILVIDDAATVRLYHRSILEDAGYDVGEAVNGLEALEKALQTPFDLYVVDVNMPPWDGYGFLQRLRLAETTHAPAIMVSTEAAESDEALAYSAGADAYLVKPVKPKMFLTKISLLLGETLV